MDLGQTRGTWEDVKEDVPAGEYDVIVKKVSLEDKTTKDGKEYCVLGLQVSILQGEYKGYGLFLRINIFNTPISLGFYKRDMAKMGFDIAPYELKKRLNQLQDAKFTILRRQQKKSPEYMENIPLKPISTQAEEDINEIVDDSNVYVNVKDSKDDMPF